MDAHICAVDAASVIASISFHVVHYGVLFGLPAVVALAVMRWVPSEPDKDAATERRNDWARTAFGGMPAATRTSEERARTRRVLGSRMQVPYVECALSIAAGAIHAAVVQEHLREFWLFGAFFIGSAAAQICWAIVALRFPSRKLLFAAVAGNTTIVGLWVVSRTVGLPLGPEPWHPEAARALDVAASACEVLIVAGCVRALVRPRLTTKTLRPAIPPAA